MTKNPKRAGQRALMRRSGYHTVGEIARAAGVTDGTVYRMLEEGRLRALKQGRSTWIELASACEAWSELPPIVASLRLLASAA